MKAKTKKGKPPKKAAKRPSPKAPAPAAPAAPAIKFPEGDPFITQPVQVKLTWTERRVLDRLIGSKFYQSRSEAIRSALGKLFDGHLTDAEGIAIERERRIHRPRRHRGR